MQLFSEPHHSFGMKLKNKSLLIVFALVIAGNVLSQVEELKKAQDKRKEYIDPNGSNNYFSKLDYVNPFIGTGGHGHTYPGASTPFGMIQLSPDTRHDGWDGCSGYHYSDSIIYGFSHTHLSGTGVPDYCDLLIVPQSGKPRVDPGYEVDGGYGAQFEHSDEKASPGKYSVYLKSEEIQVDLTVSDRCGYHEYTFKNPKGKKFILIDLDHRDELLDSELNILNNNTISGSRISSAWAREQHFYFYLETSTDFQKARKITKDGRHKLLLVFRKQTETVRIKVGISAVDIEGAKKNLAEEIPNWHRKRIETEARNKWRKELDKIHFESADREVLTNFYTALYHSYLNPNLFNDVDGRYRGRDLQIHTLNEEEGRNYTVFSLWDTYRATHPLFTLTQVERTNEFIRTFIRQYQQGGDLPVWELAANETECMIGYHSVSVMADAYMKGIRDYSEKGMFTSMRATSVMDEFGKLQFIKQGYISSGDEPESVSKTLEYAYDNFCIATVNEHKLRGTGLRGIHRHFYRSALNFINVYDPESGFMRARRHGLWHTPFDPAEVNFNYTEANSWQYSLYAPHAISILAELMGGKGELENWLDQLFTTESDLSGRHQVDITGLIGQYAHGNEPSHHMAYLYNYTNAPHKTQYYVDKILKEMYHNAPDGLSGNEDCGQMSSWYVLSALGLYQITPGHPYYDLGRPLMNVAKLNLENGNVLTISAVNNSDENKYVQDVFFNGEKLSKNMISHHELIEGGTLKFVMGSEPPKKPLPPNESAMIIEDFKRLNFVPLPFFENKQRIFEDSLIVSIAAHKNLSDFQHKIEYRLKSDTSKVYTYKEPFTIYESTEIEARQVYSVDLADNSAPLFMNYESNWVPASFSQRDKSISIEIKSSYDSQYAASGINTLIDGVKGGNEYRTGDWQGYWAQPFEAIITFDEPRTISEIEVGFLSDMRSWIFLPSEVNINYSYDGKSFEGEGITQLIKTEGKDEMPAHVTRISTRVSPDKAVKSIRVYAENFGKCPEWHLGNGNDTWLFLDEITVR